MFKKGQSGNPNGRPRKGKSLTDLLEKYGKQRIKAEGETKKVARKDLLAKKLWELALAGDSICIKYIYDRIDGKPINKFEQVGDQTNPMYDKLCELTEQIKNEKDVKPETT